MVDTKLHEIALHLARIDERLGHYNKSLDEHIKRTNILEEQMQTALLPIKLAKTIGSIAAGAAAVLAVMKALGKI